MQSGCGWECIICYLDGPYTQLMDIAMEKYIKNFMDDVLEMFDEGEKDKIHKMGPGRM